MFRQRCASLTVVFISSFTDKHISKTNCWELMCFFVYLLQQNIKAGTVTLQYIVHKHNSVGILIEIPLTTRLVQYLVSSSSSEYSRYTKCNQVRVTSQWEHTCFSFHWRLCTTFPSTVLLSRYYCNYFEISYSYSSISLYVAMVSYSLPELSLQILVCTR